LEPLLLLGMGLLVGFIALSVLLPIFQLIRVFKR
jgi:type II secretory pathway component PulF